MNKLLTTKLDDIAYQQSPADPVNYMRGREGHAINQITLHSMDGYMKGTIGYFQTPRPQAPTSAHYGIGWDGNIVQFVDEVDTAYHAGDWNVNLTSIGIEHEDLATPYITRPDVLYTASARLVADICQRYNIPCDKDHIKVHSEVSDHITECPTGLDRDRIVALAHAILNPIPTPPAVGGPVPDTTQHTVTITPTQGANIRTTPDPTGTNVAKAFPQGTVVPVETSVVGVAPSGETNTMWWKLAGESLYVWSGVTSEVPSMPVVATPEPVTPDPIPATPAVEEVPVVSPAVLQLQLDQMKADNLVLANSVKSLTQENSEANAKINDLTEKNMQLTSDYADYLTLKKANEVLSDTVTIYKNKATQAAQSAFTGWEMYDLPKGRALLTRLGLALRLFQLTNKSPFVVAWKQGMQLKKVS